MSIYYHSKLILDNKGNVFIIDNNSETSTFVKIDALELYEKNILFIQNKNT